MNEGDKIIWDSGFGYEVGVFISEDAVYENKSKVDLKTGVVTGPVCHWNCEITLYTTQRLNEMEKRYGMRKLYNV